MRRMGFMAVLMVAAVAQAAGAQEQRREAPRTAPDSATIEQLRRILHLPQTAERARQAGIPDSQVQSVLRRTHERAVPAEDAQRTIEQETEAVERGGDRGEFGKFVQSQIDAGLRGQELSHAIRAEHARRGIGKPKGEGARPSAEPERAGRGKPENAKPQGKPDTTKGKERRGG